MAPQHLAMMLIGLAKMQVGEVLVTTTLAWSRFDGPSVECKQLIRTCSSLTEETAKAVQRISAGTCCTLADIAAQLSHMLKFMLCCCA
jgi:hypothetical protein